MQCRILIPPDLSVLILTILSTIIIDATAFAMFATVVTCQKGQQDMYI